LEAGDATRSSDDEGDFINLEVAVAFRARAHGKSLKDRSGNPHILMEFQVAGGLLLPVFLFSILIVILFYIIIICFRYGSSSPALSRQRECASSSCRTRPSSPQ
jgi:hypothetical protein